jgi:DNA-binding PadR family transcriptional regulator
MNWNIFAIVIFVLCLALVALGYALKSRPSKEILVLHILGDSGMGGLDIARRSQGKLKEVLVNSTLRDMERQGLLSTFEAPDTRSERGGRSRTIYSATSKGKELLASSPPIED